MPVLNLENGACMITPADEAGARTFVEGGNFTLEWLMRPNEAYPVESDQEALVLFSRAGGTIHWDDGTIPVPPMTIVITPPGSYRISAEASGAAMIIATARADVDRAQSINAGKAPNPRIAAPGQPFVRSSPLAAPLLLPIDTLPVPAAPREMAVIVVSMPRYVQFRSRFII